MSIKYCPNCGKTIETFPTKLLFWSMSLSILAIAVISCHYTFSFRSLPIDLLESLVSSNLLEFFCNALLFGSLGLIAFALKLSMKNKVNLCSCQSNFISLPNYELIGSTCTLIGSFLLCANEETSLMLANLAIFMAGIIIFATAPMAKLATLKLYKELYPARTSLDTSTDNAVPISTSTSTLTSKIKKVLLLKD